MKRVTVLLLFVVLFTLLTVPVFAQDDVPAEPTAPLFGAPTPEEAWGGLINSLTAIFVAVPTSAFGVLVVSLVKRLPFAQDISAPVINLAVGMVLTVIVWGAGALSLTPQLKTLAEVILAVAPILIGTGASSWMAAGAYDGFAKDRLPIIGYSRS